MKRLTLTSKVLFLISSVCAISAAAFAADLQVAPNSSIRNLCEASLIAAPGDTVTFSGRQEIASNCAWTASGVVIRGAGQGAAIVVADGDRTWRIEAAGVTLENFSLDSSGLDISGPSPTLRGLRVSGAVTGVRIGNAEESQVTVEHCVFRSNETDISVGQVDSFALIWSTLSGRNGVASRAKVNEIRSNRFSFRGGESDSRAFAAINASRSSIEDNLFESTTAEGAAFVQLSDEIGQAHEALVAGNTMVSRAGSGTRFIEILGETRPTLKASRNIFWGPGSVAELGDTILQENYIGEDQIFAGEQDFRLTGSLVPANWGAKADVLEAGSIAFAAEAAATPKLESARALISGLAVTQVSLKASAVSGSTYLFGNTVRLSTPAPSGGLSVRIASSNPNVVTPFSSAVNVPGGSTTGTFSLRTTSPSTPTTAILTATANGTSDSAQLAVTPVKLKSVTLQSSSQGAGSLTQLNRVFLSGPAPAGGMTIYLRSSHSLVDVPSSVHVTAGVNNAAFTVKVAMVTSALTATITASHSTGSVSDTVSVKPAGLRLLYVGPSSIKGGIKPLMRVFLSGNAPAGGKVVYLRSSNPAVASVPASITIPAGTDDKSLLVTTHDVSSTKAVTFTATSDGGSESATLTVLP
jgi:hypothetical protein